MLKYNASVLSQCVEGWLRRIAAIVGIAAAAYLLNVHDAWRIAGRCEAHNVASVCACARARGLTSHSSDIVQYFSGADAGSNMQRFASKTHAPKNRQAKTASKESGTARHVIVGSSSRSSRGVMGRQMPDRWGVQEKHKIDERT